MTANDLPLTKEEILDAAEQVLRRFGPDKTSVVDIAKVLKVSHGTLYRHFASKVSIREAVTERWLRLSITVPLDTLAEQTGGSAAAHLRLWMETLIGLKRTFSVEDAEMFKMYAAVTLSEVEIIEAHVNRLITQMGRLIDSGMLTGEFKEGNSEQLARALFLATSPFHHPAHAKAWISDSHTADFDAVWQLLMSGLLKK
ncbi:TetR/AcrR family transcriptional regulator [Paenibacillus paeoniae]|uniref:TetR/AcrR family transcriptional regulator n=1 Tax=Paenibacillus paeoniae TaxID=2292705 RepID=A0A371PFL5_9BACL|nr:TetR/AcrR family transcriptional regulator [Paenibacillus paeoniae]REK74278.1 TetR/AcrR family transcriptional regulator [Paenibacillus paeoniae]